MARNPRNRGPRRSLTVLLSLLVLLFGGLGAAKVWADPPAQLTPLLGLDLAGGRQIVIEPVVEGGDPGDVQAEQVNQAIDIIRRRIDGGGVGEAEVSRIGGSNIAVAIPGNPTPAQLEALSRSSQLQFRPVLQAEQVLPDGQSQQPRELPVPPGLTPDPSESTGAPGGSSDDAERTNAAYPEGLLADDAASTDGGGQQPDDAEQTGEPQTPAAQNPSDLAQITPELQEQFTDLDCADTDVTGEVADADPDAPVVACASDGSEKYILGPREVSGAQVEDASSGLQSTSSGQSSGIVEVRLSFDSDGTAAFRETTSRLFGYPEGSPQNRFAIVLDGSVLSAPTVRSTIADGNASITGGFTTDSAQELANQLKFGALPISFDVQTSQQVSPTLGGEQLRLGIIAGIIGLALVFFYSLAQYRALGLVTIGSLVTAALMAYGSVTFLGWSTNFRLTMAGITGLIVAIGITADSFIVYFERIRDEVRAGRPLRFAVDTGWERARRTILISDAVNLIAAAVLYWLSESGVKAFAFALGLTTVIDLIVVFLFTHPVVSILANTRFFGEGHKLSGMHPESLGAKRSTYLGRGQFTPPERRRSGHSRADLEGGVV